MTTRTELLDAFESKLADEGSFLMPAPGNQAMPDGRSYIHATYASLDGERSVEWHIAVYWDNVADNVSKAQFYVVDRGTEGEDATWFQGKDPRPEAPEPTFQQEMRAWLEGKIDEAIGNVTVRHIESVTADNALERGTANVILETGTGDFVRESIAVWRVSDEWQFKVIS